jgi:hypothetical protein
MMGALSVVGRPPYSESRGAGITLSLCRPLLLPYGFVCRPLHLAAPMASFVHSFPARTDEQPGTAIA